MERPFNRRMLLDVGIQQSCVLIGSTFMQQHLAHMFEEDLRNWTGCSVRRKFIIDPEDTARESEFNAAKSLLDTDYFSDELEWKVCWNVFLRQPRINHIKHW